MDPNAPLATWLLIARWWDRRALRRVKAYWGAWEAAHPRQSPDEFTRRWELREQLRRERMPAYIQAHLLRHRLEEAELEAQVQAILETERWASQNGEGS